MLHRILLLCFIILSACAAPQDNKSFSYDSLGQVNDVRYGTILSIEDVDVQGTKSGIGVGSGALLGGIAGSAVGGAEQTTLAATVGGALIGGLLGDIIEDKATKAKASLFVIKLDNGEDLSLVEVDKHQLKTGEKIMLIGAGDHIKILRAPSQ